MYRVPSKVMMSCDCDTKKTQTMMNGAETEVMTREEVSECSEGWIVGGMYRIGSTRQGSSKSLLLGLSSIFSPANFLLLRG